MEQMNSAHKDEFVRLQDAASCGSTHTAPRFAPMARQSATPGDFTSMNHQDLIAAIDAVHQAMPAASDEEIARELHAKFPEVNHDALIDDARLESMIDGAKGWTSRVIAVQTESGPVEIDAEVLGYLALHDGVVNREFTVITHVPTGFKVAALPPQIRIEALRRTVERLQKFNWDFNWDSEGPRCPFPQTTMAEIRSILGQLVEGSREETI
jgi:hypothetical protein